MNLHQVDLNLLKSLKYILETKSITKASLKLGLSQPAISQSFKKLKEIFNDPLLIKEDGKTILTHRAQYLMAKLDIIFNQLDEALFSETTFEPTKQSAFFKIASSDYGLSQISDMLKCLLANSNIKAEVHLTEGERDFVKLQKRELDFYFGVGNRLDLPSSLIVKKLYSEKFLSCVHKSHPLASLKRKTIDLEDYLSFPHILVANQNLNNNLATRKYSLGVIDLFLKKQAKEREVVFTLPYFNEAISFLKNSPYILTAPSRVIENGAYFSELFTFETPLVKEHDFDFYIAWHSNTLLKPQNRWFLDQITQWNWEKA